MRRVPKNDGISPIAVAGIAISNPVKPVVSSSTATMMINVPMLTTR